VTAPPDRGAGHAVGVDIGGTNLRIALVDATGGVGRVDEYSTPVAVGTDPDEAATALVTTLEAAIARTDPSGALPIGIGFAGAITTDGRAVYGPNVSTRDLPIRDEVVAETGNEAVTVINDANAAAWGEYRFGAGRDVEDMVMVTLGTGVGGGVVVHGRLVEGKQGFGGELGHMTLVADGWECNCGNRGCLEAYASGRSLTRHAADLLATGRPSTLAGATLTPADVSRAARDGDELAIDAIAAAGQWLGIGVAALVNVLDPDMVVIGGGVTEHVREWLMPVVRTVVPRRTVGRLYRTAPEIVVAELGDRAGMIGAADMARRRAG
jgi:glucokinase